MKFYKKPELKPVILWGKNHIISSDPVRKTA